MNTAILLPISPLSERQLQILRSGRKLSRRTLLRYRNQVKSYIAILDAVSATNYAVLAPYGYSEA